MASYFFDEIFSDAIEQHKEILKHPRTARSTRSTLSNISVESEYFLGFDPVLVVVCPVLSAHGPDKRVVAGSATGMY